MNLHIDLYTKVHMVSFSLQILMNVSPPLVHMVLHVLMR